MAAYSRKSRFGKTFFSCTNYPDCDVIVCTLDQLKAKYPNHPKTPYVKKGRRGKFGKESGSCRNARRQKSRSQEEKNSPAYLQTLPELSSLLGHKELSRPEVTKQLWVYIKSHNLKTPRISGSSVPMRRSPKSLAQKLPST